MDADDKRKLDAVYTAIVGDPTDEQRPGIIRRMDRHEGRITDCERRLSEERGHRKWLERSVLGAAITVIVTIALTYALTGG